MYHPYFRGKQYDLIAIRELASILAASHFYPIIEPVRDALSGLQKALTAVAEADGKAIVIVNPIHGELSDGAESLTQLLKDEFLNLPGISAGILLKEDMTAEDAMTCYATHAEHSPVFLHAGFTPVKTLAEQLSPFTPAQKHIFFERCCGKLYQKHFKGSSRVLLRDGFQRKKTNRDYVPLEMFSDLHATFLDEGMNGFGDFLIVGDDYIDGGGPAYAIAIHLTFIDPDQDDTMYIYHFVSDTQDTPKDPAGKFAEALAKMINVLDSPTSKVHETDAVQEFRSLHEQGHFPGLGYVKKLSMKHHVQTLAHYFQELA